MPLLLRYRGNEFRFRAVDRTEPAHVHVRGRTGGQAKIWLMPTVRLQRASGYSRREQDEIIRITKAHRGKVAPSVA
ncbi:MAG: DUF4160 domain-containing protein [Chloroflexota bacterium]|nr:DUF4160 domain-containing protein [Chloroflexota bacterium]MDE3102043.1 DUF4160 domain-containing protein [Chloroflexota bacterium]